MDNLEQSPTMELESLFAQENFPELCVVMYDPNQLKIFSDEQMLDMKRDMEDILRSS